MALSVPAMRAFFYDIQPALFTSDGSHAIALLSDNSLVTSQHPARPRDVLTLYGTGFGPVSPLTPTGDAAGASPLSVFNPGPSVSINTHTAIVVSAGLSPGFVSLYRFNIVVPDGLGTGDLPALMSVGGQISNIVSIPVQGQAGVVSELIRNGGFESPMNGEWLTYVDSNSVAAATFERTTSTVHDGDYAEHVSVTAAGNLANVQFDQRNIPFIQGVTYKFQGWAKSSNAGTMRVACKRAEAISIPMALQRPSGSARLGSTMPPVSKPLRPLQTEA